jgi:hypothetical protein
MKLSLRTLSSDSTVSVLACHVCIQIQAAGVSMVDVNVAAAFRIRTAIFVELLGNV